MEKLEFSSHRPEKSSKGILCLHAYSSNVPRVSPLSSVEPWKTYFWKECCLVMVGSSYHIYYLRMTTYYFVRQQLLNVETYLIFWRRKREHRVKPSTDKNHPLLQPKHKTTGEVRNAKHAGSTNHDLNCERYLGLPMVGAKSKVSTFREV